MNHKDVELTPEPIYPWEDERWGQKTRRRLRRLVYALADGMIEAGQPIDTACSFICRFIPEVGSPSVSPTGLETRMLDYVENLPKPLA